MALAHSWRYAKSGRVEAGFRWKRTIGLGVGGDWMIAPKVEGALLSGTRLARAMLVAT